jgi:hypothetical protein
LVKVTGGPGRAAAQYRIRITTIERNRSLEVEGRIRLPLRKM